MLVRQMVVTVFRSLVLIALVNPNFEAKAQRDGDIPSCQVDYRQETCHENMDYVDFTDFSGGSSIQKHANVENAIKCQTLCQLNPTCQFYSYTLSSKTCLLKDNVGRKVPNPDRLSGPRTCPGRCFEDGVDSAGKDIENFRVSSIDECQNECKKVFNCKLFVYAPSTKNCWLKHTASARTINSDRITGPRVCAADCFDEGKDYSGNNIASIPAISSPYFCLMECKKRSDCLFYSYNLESKLCLLKNTDGVSTPSPVTVSGSAVCQPREFCFDVASDYPGADIGSSLAFSTYQCQIQCQKFSGCKFFTYDLASKICSFKNAKSNKNRKNYAISGPSKCYEGLCTTTTYTKLNGEIACGYDLKAALTWSQSVAECAKNGARLPEILDAQEDKDIFLRKGSQSDWMWLGMSDLKKEGTFVWNSSNAPIKYTNWNTGTGEPNGGTNENCGTYWGPGPYWNDLVCDFTWCPQPMCELILHGSSEK